MEANPNPTASVAWDIVALARPPRRRCPSCSGVLEYLDEVYGPCGWCAVCWFAYGPLDAGSDEVAA